jgi:hypothetical protein
MSEGGPVLFNEALANALATTRAQGAGIADELTLVRDLRGRIRLLLPGARSHYDGSKRAKVEALSAALAGSLGAYGFPPQRSVLYLGELSQSPTAPMLEGRIRISDETGPRILLLDRQVSGQDWLADPLARRTANPRLTFYGLKGGVGRSTAMIVWAWFAAKAGRSVLIFDLDLESPGASSTLLPEENLPDYGIVDWFVEGGVGQAHAVERQMVASSPLGRGLAGEIRVVPAFGRMTTDYLPKLSRTCAFDVHDSSSWGERLGKLVGSVEAAERPDAVALDSRAGLHDIAAAAVTRMDAQTLLFAADSPQTWRAYSFLFRHWRQHPRLPAIRDRLQIVAAMVPETGRLEHLDRFRQNSWDLFREHLYEEVGPGATGAFTFDLGDEDGPHNPWPIYWHRGLQEFAPAAPAGALDETIAREALGSFVDRTERLVKATGGPEA